MITQEKSKFALLVFDARAEVDSQSVSSLERLLRSSERYAVGYAVRLRVAALSESSEGVVNAIALAGLPAAIDEVQITDRLEQALLSLAQRGAKFDRPRNIALAALGDNSKIISDGAAALRYLLNQVGAGAEPLGKILRLFTPPGIDITADPTARHAAAQRLRTKLGSRIKDMLSETDGAGQTIGFVEAGAEEPDGLILALEDLLRALPPPHGPAVDGLVAEVRQVHRQVAPSLRAFLGVYRALGERVEALCQEIRNGEGRTGEVREHLARLSGSAEAIARTSVTLEGILK
ncbi:MAG TPA: hypothetical protein VEY95_09635 [Azospirillaceae bacterium]|nr:hypothetical protein [Azospirillaceae bacterium]